MNTILVRRTALIAQLIVSSLMLSNCGTFNTSAVPAPVSARGDAAAPTASSAPSAAPATVKAGEGNSMLKQGGGFYKDDGPGDHPPENLQAISDAVPRVEPLHKFANKPYTVLGHDYVPMQELGAYRMRGMASWYGKKFHGQKTSTGETYDMYAMTAAHPTLPIPSYARVTSLTNGKSIIVRVNDRGPFHADRIMDLSYTAAWKLGLVGGGSGMVEVVSLNAGDPLPAAAEEAPVVVTNDEVNPIPAIEDSRGAWLQLGAFGNRSNADAFKSRLASELGEMGDKLVVRESERLYRVHLGPWADAQQARGVAEKLAETLGVKPVLVNN